MTQAPRIDIVVEKNVLERQPNVERQDYSDFRLPIRKYVIIYRVNGEGCP